MARQTNDTTNSCAAQRTTMTARHNPIVPLIIHTVERGLRQVEPESELDELFCARVQAMEGVPLDVLRRLVKEFHASQYVALIPPELRDLKPDRAVNLDEVAPILRRNANARFISDHSKPASRTLEAQRHLNRRLVAAAVEGGYLWHTDMISRNTIVDYDHDLISPLDEDAIPAALTPVIDHLEPSTPKGYEPTDKVVIVGKMFHTKKSGNSVVLYLQMSNGSQAKIKTISPQATSTTALQFVLPGDLDSGHYLVQVVTTTNKLQLESNKMPLSIKMPQHYIEKFLPSKPRPGQTVIVEGKHFEDLGPDAYTVHFKNISGGISAGFTKAKRLNDTQLEFEMDILNTPGYYHVAVGRNWDDKSPWVGLEIAPGEYKVEFYKAACLKEADVPWHYFEGGSDELIFGFTVVSGTQAVVKLTGEYGSVDTGDQYHLAPQDKSVFPGPGLPGPVHRFIAISVAFYENDDSDPGTTQKIIGLAGEIAAMAGAATGNPYAIAAGQAAPMISESVGVIAELLGGRQLLGQHDQTWEAYLLQFSTQQSHDKELQIYAEVNAGKDGHHMLIGRITRTDLKGQTRRSD